MSLPIQLPPIQSAPPKPTQDSVSVKSVDQPEPLQAKDRDDFKQAMQTAGKQKSPTSEDEAASEKNNSVDNEEPDAATADGNRLPDGEGGNGQFVLASGENTQVLVEQSINLNLGAAHLSAEQADDAVLLATQFVVDSLPAALKEGGLNQGLTGNAANQKPDILVRLQAHISQAALTPGTELLESGELKLASLQELGLSKSGESHSRTQAQVDALIAQNNQVNATDAKLSATQATKAEIVVPNRVGSEGWSEAMAGRISLLVNQRISAARIHINPPELGPIEVRVNLNNDQASVQFTSQSAQVRDALEQSIPRLRDMLESAGFSLADSGVNDQEANDQQSGGGEDNEAGVEETIAQTQKRESLGLVDDYV